MMANHASKLKRALDVGGGIYSPLDIAQAVAEGRMQSWTRGDSLVVTEVLRFPRKSLANIVLAMGDLEDVMALQPGIEEFGQGLGCEKLVMAGRPGWVGVLPRFGWTKTNRVVFEKGII